MEEPLTPEKPNKHGFKGKKNTNQGISLGVDGIMKKINVRISF